MWSPQDSDLWHLDRFLSKYCRWCFCSSCGCFRFDSPCHAQPHWTMTNKTKAILITTFLLTIDMIVIGLIVIIAKLWR